MQGSGGGHRVTDQRVYEAPLWQFLDHCESVFGQYPKHRLTLAKQKAAHLKCDRNYRPGTLLSDVDFAENYEIVHARWRFSRRTGPTSSSPSSFRSTLI